MDRDARMVVMDFEPCKIRFEHTLTKRSCSQPHPRLPPFLIISGIQKDFRRRITYSVDFDRYLGIGPENVGPKGDRKMIDSLLDTRKCAKARVLLMTHFSLCIQTISKIQHGPWANTNKPSVLHEPGRSTTRTTYAQIECKKLRDMVTHPGQS